MWSPPDAPTAALLTACGIRDLGLLAARCAQLRRNLGQAAGCWSAPALLPAVQLAVIHRQHPAGQVVAALLAVAADPVTRSPMRVAEAGPWWTPAPGVAAAPVVEDPELAALEARLAATDGRRPTLQAKARAQLAAEREPVTRAAVARRACALLDAEQDDAEQDEAEHNDDQADHDEGEDVGA